jgi:hypothetical protein
MVPRDPAGRYATGVSERAEVATRAVEAYRALSELAETVEDEWQYVTDLTEAYAAALEALGGAAEPLPPGAVEAVDEAIEEIGLISDPHRAIDWLSTFPHVVAIALGGDVDSAGEGVATDDRTGEPEGPDDDNPFRLLLGGGR